MKVSNEMRAQRNPRRTPVSGVVAVAVGLAGMVALASLPTTTHLVCGDKPKISLGSPLVP